MGWKASMIIIQNKSGVNDDQLLLDTLGLSNYVYEEDTVLDRCIWPGDDSINIGHFSDNIIICDDCQIIDDFITDKLTQREKDLIKLFPSSEILSVACISTTNYHGYCLIKEGKKVRGKSLNADEGFYMDFGEHIKEEKAIYETSELIDGERVWRFDNLPGDIFKEDQLMENFTFGVAKRLLGVRIDTIESDFLMEEVVFKKYKANRKTYLLEDFSMKGQWLGYFEYGEEYGEEIAGEKVQFRLFVDEFQNGEFKGKAADLEGFGSSFDQAELRGFLEGDFISFTKQYPYFMSFDENNNSIVDKSKPHPLVSYEGYYDPSDNTFKGEWEMSQDVEPNGDGWIENVCKGKWEIRRDD